MNEEFEAAYRMVGVDWLSWIGQPMLYDGGLCVNRTLEEREWSATRRGQLMV